MRWDLTTNGVIISDAIEFVHTNKEKLTTVSTNEEENGKESRNQTTTKMKTS